MAADWSKGPKPYTQRQARTIFVRVASSDWPLVKRGMRATFIGALGQSSAAWNTPIPTPVVAYAVIRGRGHDSRLMILEDKRQEMLGAIDPTEVGYEDMASFRRAWMRGEVRKFRPLTKVFVYTVRPFGEGDREEMALAIFDRLYGEFRDGDRALVS